jgi:DNA primase large subunit
VTQVSDPPLSAQAPESATTQDLLRLLEAMEQTLRTLQAEMPWRSEEMDQRIERAENRLIFHLKERLDEERAKRERPLMKYSMVVERHKAMMESRANPDLTKENTGPKALTTPSGQFRRKYIAILGRNTENKGNRVEPGSAKRTFDIEPVTSVRDHAHRPRSGLFSWLKGSPAVDGD